MAKAKSEKIMFYGTGRRKKSIARVRLVEGTGKITINGKDIDEYFGTETLKVIVKQPLNSTNTLGKYDVICKVIGGGFTGQAAKAVGKCRNGFQPTARFLCFQRLFVVNGGPSKSKSFRFTVSPADMILLWSRSLSVIKLYYAQSAKAIVSCTLWC